MKFRTKKIFVLDTSVLLTNADSLLYFSTLGNVVLPIKVLEELDKHKQRQDSVGANARRTIKFLDEFRENGSLSTGVKVHKGKSNKIFVYSFQEVRETFPTDFNEKIPDHQIIATANHLSKIYPTCKVSLISRDINMRVSADSIGLPCGDYNPDNIVKEGSEIYTGFSEILVDDELIDRFYSDELIYTDSLDIKEILNPNQFIMLISSQNQNKTALCRYREKNFPLRKVIKQKNSHGLVPRNKEQSFAFDLLFDINTPLVTLVGSAGTGKTLCALSAGLEQVVGQESHYTRLIVSRPVQPMGKDIGFLPGTMEEKMAPWLTPIQDNLQFLLGNDKIMLQEYLDRGTIEIEALTFIRGRSISNAFIIIDEAQNLTKHELKTIITRVGEGSKIILTGDIQQIDNAYITETSNGLVHAVESFKKSDLAGHISFVKGERSTLATMAAKIL